MGPLRHMEEAGVLTQGNLAVASLGDRGCGNLTVDYVASKFYELNNNTLIYTFIDLKTLIEF